MLQKIFETWKSRNVINLNVICVFKLKFVTQFNVINYAPLQIYIEDSMKFQLLAKSIAILNQSKIGCKFLVTRVHSANCTAIESIRIKRSYNRECFVASTMFEIMRCLVVLCWLLRSPTVIQTKEKIHSYNASKAIPRFLNKNCFPTHTFPI